MPAVTRRAFLQSALLAPAALGQQPKPEPPLGVPAKAVTKGPKHHWFGYYDKTPWDATGRYLLCMESDFCDRQPKAGEEISVGIVDLKDNNKFTRIDKTAAWCWQQGTMLQWWGIDSKSFVVYNAVVDKQYVGRIFNFEDQKTSTIPRPIYALSADGKHAVSLDFARLHRLRPGYGYATVPEIHANHAAPNELGIWHIDMLTRGVDQIVNLAQLAANKPDDRFTGAEHWVNHLQFSPSGNRFAFLHRWKKPNTGFTTRIYTVKPDGTDLKLLHDSGLISHYDWRDDETILAWVRLKRDDKQLAFALLHLNGNPPTPIFDDEKVDGHCSWSPNRKWVLNDTYPDKERFQRLMLLNAKTGRRHDLNKFRSPKTFTGPFRCDLHPRWNRDGTQVCFDGCHEPTRQVYVVDVAEIVKSS